MAWVINHQAKLRRDVVLYEIGLYTILFSWFCIQLDFMIVLDLLNRAEGNMLRFYSDKAFILREKLR